MFWLVFVSIIGICLGIYAMYITRKLREKEDDYVRVCTNVSKLELKIYDLLKEN